MPVLIFGTFVQPSPPPTDEAALSPAHGRFSRDALSDHQVGDNSGLDGDRGAAPQRANTSWRPSATRATSPSVISGKNGNASDRLATSSHTGNSPSRCPNRSR
jgi:hypothetical protein